MLTLMLDERMADVFGQALECSARATMAQLANGRTMGDVELAHALDCLTATREAMTLLRDATTAAQEMQAQSRLDTNIPSDRPGASDATPEQPIAPQSFAPEAKANGDARYMG